MVDAVTGAKVLALRDTVATATSLNFTGLANGTAVRFQVQAWNAKGMGPVSSHSNAVVPATTVPGMPVIKLGASGVAGGTVSATANWALPASNGGSAINGYVVTAWRMSATGTILSRTPSAVQAAGPRSLAVTLPAGNYRFVIQARNAKGLSAASANSNQVTAR